MNCRTLLARYLTRVPIVTHASGWLGRLRQAANVEVLKRVADAVSNSVSKFAAGIASRSNVAGGGRPRNPRWDRWIGAAAAVATRLRARAPLHE
jgi:hypothetical protein